MHWQRLAGFGICSAGVMGYLIGVYVPYTGRAFSITAVMVGVAMAAIGSPEAAETAATTETAGTAGTAETVETTETAKTTEPTKTTETTDTETEAAE